MWGNPTLLKLLREILRKDNEALIEKSKYWDNQAFW